MGIFYSVEGCNLVTVGRDVRADIYIDEPYVSRLHFTFRPLFNGDTALVTVISKNGLTISGKSVGKGVSREVGKSDLIYVGGYCFVWLCKVILISFKGLDSVNYFEYDKKIVFKNKMRLVLLENLPTQKGIVQFQPSIRKINNYDFSAVEVDFPPSRKLPERANIAIAAGPALTMAIPILLGCGRTVSVVSSVIAAFWAVANVVNRQRKLRIDETRRRNMYYEYIKECDKRIQNKISEYRYYIKQQFPSIEEYFANGGNPFLLWNRFEVHDREIDKTDFSYRLGIADVELPFDISIPKDKFAQIDDSLREFPEKLKGSYRTIKSLPVSIGIDIGECIGIVYENEEKLEDIVKILLMQLMVAWSPDQLIVLVDFSDINHRFIPELKYSAHFSTKEELNEDTLKRRLIITDDIAKASKWLLYDNTMIVLVKSDISMLPSVVEKVIVCSCEFNGVITTKGDKYAIEFDRLSSKLFKEYVMRLSRLWGIGLRGRTPIRDSVSFGLMFGSDMSLEGDLESYVKTNWESADTINGLKFPVGMGDNDERIYLDIHEKGMGPHGLLAGSTGSGKSELLTSIILSAAICYPPDKLGFFLIDYKGGGMSNLFSNLPHLLGSISNLSENESNRAMVSLKSENIRRQKLFNEANVNNINEYTRLYDGGLVKEPLPHVLIIIDEFAELKKEQPDFMTQIISVATIGRSLGMHLLLATQKPAGVIDDKIRSNTRFRLCLRVEDKTDSMDMIKSPDAALITNVGRGYIQVGNNEIYKCFQSAYAMGRVNNDRQNKGISVYDSYGNKINFKRNTDKVKTSVIYTWHSYCMKHIVNVSGMLKLSKCKTLWLSALPDLIEYSLKSPNEIALADAPARQMYIPIIYSYPMLGNICIIGHMKSGKSSFLITLLVSISYESTKNPINIFIIDYGGGRLKDFELLNNCGGYIIPSGDAGQVVMLIKYIEIILNERRKIADASVIDKLPTVVLIIDNYSEVMRIYGPQCERSVFDILKNGPANKIVILITSNGGSGDLPSKIIDSSKYVFVLGKQDTYQVAAYLKVSARQIINIDDEPGRGLTVVDDEVLEIKTKYVNEKSVLAVEEAFEDEQNDGDSSISGVIKCINARIGPRIRSYPHIPNDKSLEEFFNQIGDTYDEKYINITKRLPVAYEMDTGRIFEIDFSKIQSVLIVGRKGSGKKTFLSNIAIIASKYHIKSYFIKSYQTLLKFLKDDEKSTNYNTFFILLCVDLESIIHDFYEAQYKKEDEELICKAFSNRNALKRNVKIIGITSDRIRNLSGLGKFYEELMNVPFGICMGGGVYDQHLLDFSYLPYQEQTKNYPSGCGEVIKYRKSTYSGKIMIPKPPWIGEEE